jgi:catechol 2,3-dioxygenase
MHPRRFAMVRTGAMTDPEGMSQTATPVLPGTLRLGAVHLVVSDLDRSVAWYQRSLGLRVHRQDVGEAALGTGGDDVIVLHEDAQARPAGRHSGLYHYALLYASREELARAALRLAETSTPIEGASDHGTHEAIYLPDPDGNGIELAADRPREQWPTAEEEFYGGQGPRPLNFESLLGTVAGEQAHPQAGPGLQVGHVHLHVGDIDQGLAFYRDILGFEVWAVLPTAAFVAAGGYHHHLGFNVWRGQGAPPVPEHVVGLDHWQIQLETPAEVAEVRARVEAAGIPVAPSGTDPSFAVRDPWGIAVRVFST